MEKIMGQTIHRNAKGCLVRFADESGAWLTVTVQFWIDTAWQRDEWSMVATFADM